MNNDIPPTDARFGLNKRQPDEPTQIIKEPDAARKPASAPQTSPGRQPSSAHTTIIGFEPTAAQTQQAVTEPVVGWLVVLSGEGKGRHRPIFAGANTVGRNSDQRIAIDFGDQSIAREQQAFIVYDTRKRQFQIVPNLARSNLVHLNDEALLTNAELKPRDRIMMGQTTLLFVPLCGKEFDWTDTMASQKK